MTRTIDLEIQEPKNDALRNVTSEVTDRDINRNTVANDNGSNTHGRNLQTNKDMESYTSRNKTTEMTNFMDDLTLNSPKERASRSRSNTHLSRCKSAHSSSSSCSGSSSSRSSSRSWSRSRSRDRKYRRKRNRRSSRSCSRSQSRSCGSNYSYSSHYRSRSRSYSPRLRKRYSSAYRRYYRSPPRYRSRSRSYSRRSCYSRSRSRSRGRRYYGFVRRPYSPTFRSWRSRSQSRSRSRTPLRLSEKEKLALLEIAKVNASKNLGKEVDLPESLKIKTEKRNMNTSP